MQTSEPAGDASAPSSGAPSVSIHRMRNGFMVIGGGDSLSSGTVHHTIDGALTRITQLLVPTPKPPKAKRAAKA